MKFLKHSLFILCLCFSYNTIASLNVGESAPLFSLQDQSGEEFNLANRKGQWTVLYFYPKADTPGCTKQACAFRDNIKKITEQNAGVYGISINTIQEQLDFYKKNKINFPLLADTDGKISTLYRTKLPFLNISKRWTFIIGPELTILDIARDVDPVLDAQRVADKIKTLQQK